MKEAYFKRVSRIFVRPTHRNKVRFIRNLYVIKSVSERLKDNEYNQMTITIHQFIRSVTPTEDIVDYFAKDMNATSFFGNLYAFKLSYYHLQVLKGKLDYYKARSPDYITSDVYLSTLGYYNQRQAACESMYERNFKPVISFMDNYLKDKSCKY